ncbi:MAG: hypothetical protein PHQ34_01395 [Methanothrix sp.]|nr:hypothetical protein [Methanothrix sp.]
MNKKEWKAAGAGGRASPKIRKSSDESKIGYEDKESSGKTGFPEVNAKDFPVR